MQEKISKKMTAWKKRMLAASTLCLVAGGLHGQTSFFQMNQIVPAFYGEPNSEYAQFDQLVVPNTDWENPFYTEAPAGREYPGAKQLEYQ